MKRETFRAWAIDCNSKEGHGFIGRYWMFDNNIQMLPVHLRGCRIALFETRREARQRLPQVRRYSFPRAKVVRVQVQVQTVVSGSHR